MRKKIDVHETNVPLIRERCLALDDAFSLCSAPAGLHILLLCCFPGNYLSSSMATVSATTLCGYVQLLNKLCDCTAILLNGQWSMVGAVSGLGVGVSAQQ